MGWRRSADCSWRSSKGRRAVFATSSPQRSSSEKARAGRSGESRRYPIRSRISCGRHGRKAPAERQGVLPRVRGAAQGEGGEVHTCKLYLPITGVGTAGRRATTGSSATCATRGGGESHTGWGERFEHPTKTWACATHKQFTMQAVAVAIAKATWTCEEAMREVLGAG